MNVQVVHKPQKGARFVYPAVPVGQVLEVSRREADRLVATGAFQLVDAQAAEAEQAEPQAAPARGRRGSKAADAAGGEK